MLFFTSMGIALMRFATPREGSILCLYGVRIVLLVDPPNLVRIKVKRIDSCYSFPLLKNESFGESCRLFNNTEKPSVAVGIG